MRSTLAAILVCCSVAIGVRAHAQPCGCGVSRLEALPNSVQFRSAARVGYGIAENERFVGNYQLLGVSLGLAYQALVVDVSIPAYRVMRNGLEDFGLGDASLAVQLVWPLELGAFGKGQIGAYGSLMAPTGNARSQLGMGHWMLGGGAVASTEQRIAPAWRTQGSFSVGFQGALDAGTHAHGPSPFVDPMNANEVVWQGHYGLGFLPMAAQRIDVELTTSGAVPTAQGTQRAVVGGRVVWRFGAQQLALDGRGAVLGNPYQLRIGLEYGARW